MHNMQHIRTLMSRAALLGLVCAVLAGGLVGCGQKGPLYLPQQQSKPKPAPAAKPAAPATQNTDQS